MYASGLVLLRKIDTLTGVPILHLLIRPNGFAEGRIEDSPSTRFRSSQNNDCVPFSPKTNSEGFASVKLDLWDDTRWFT